MSMILVEGVAPTAALAALTAVVGAIHEC